MLGCLGNCRSIAVPNTFEAGPLLWDIRPEVLVFQIKASATSGRLWSHATIAPTNLTIDEVKAGIQRLGNSSCWIKNATITNTTQHLALEECGLQYQTQYFMYVYIDSTDVALNGTLAKINFTVPESPNPVPVGPFCFDLDQDYLQSKVVGTIRGVINAEDCQEECLSSPFCKHFRYVYNTTFARYRECDLLSTGPLLSDLPFATPGFIMGPKSCTMRSIGTLRPAPSRAWTIPDPAARAVPFRIAARGTNFDQNNDRMVAVPLEHSCGDEFIAQTNGSSPNSLSGWASMFCGGPLSSVSLLVCGLPPQSIIFSTVGSFKVCICDASMTPYGCDYLGGQAEHFDVNVKVEVLSIAGPYPGHVRYCAVGRACEINNVQGHLMAPGDKVMLRESCGTQSRPTIQAYSEASRPSPAGWGGTLYMWAQPNTAQCPPSHIAGPCSTARMCYCPASSPEYACSDDSDFITDLGEMIFYGLPSPPDKLAVIQEDYRSFTVRWDYPQSDGGGSINNYTLYFRTCPGGGADDGSTTSVTVPALPGDNRAGRARNGTHQFRSVLYGLYYIDVEPATRYCVHITASSNAGESNPSAELQWVTDVHPPVNLRYLQAPLYLEKGVAMTPLTPTVTTQDCSSLPSATGPSPHINPTDCNVQLYEVKPSLPVGLSLDPQTGVISGTPTVFKPRPEVYIVTVTNSGGKSSFYLSLSVVDTAKEGSVAFCLSSLNTINDAVITFETPEITSGPDWFRLYSQHPQTLRLISLDPTKLEFYQVSGAVLGQVRRVDAVPCGSLILDSWSSSPQGFPAATLCYWEGRTGRDQWVDIEFQGGATFEAATLYQMLVKLRVSEALAKDTQVLQLLIFATEASGEGKHAGSQEFGLWTPVTRLPSWERKLSMLPPTLLDTPLPDAPWNNGQPYYMVGYKNPLLGDAPYGYEFPWGFPAPMVTSCQNSVSNCPTAQHVFTNKPTDTRWYQDTDEDKGMFPSFALVIGVAVILSDVLRTMPFTPFADFNITALPRPPVALGNVQPLRVANQEFRVDFKLSAPPQDVLFLERDLIICPSSLLQMPRMKQAPFCEISSGPQYVECLCDSTFPLRHKASRCDKIRLRVSEEVNIRTAVSATLKIDSGMSPTFAGFVPVKWYAQVKSKEGGLFSFQKTPNAGLEVAPDRTIGPTTPVDCANECLKYLKSTPQEPVPCRSFRFNKVDNMCYLTQYVEQDLIPLKRDWPGDVYDNYEYQPQQVYAIPTPEYLFFPGLFVSAATIRQDTYLEPPEPSAPPFDVPHFFPSYARQLYILFSIDLVFDVPIHGQDPWKSYLEITPPAGFQVVALQAYGGKVPTPQGLGYCHGPGGTCRWYLSRGQVLWGGVPYRLQLTLHNAPTPFVIGQPWHLLVSSAGLDQNGPVQNCISVQTLHPLPVEGWLQGCAVHFSTTSAVLPSGHTSTQKENSADIFFVTPQPWRNGTTLTVVMPKGWSIPATCFVRTLTPWLAPEHLECKVATSSLAVLFAAPAQANAAIGLRIGPLQLPKDFATVAPGFRVWPVSLDTIQPASLNILFRISQPEGPMDKPRPDYACHPAAWSCGLHPFSWPAAVVALRPSRHAFSNVRVRYDGPAPAEPFRRRNGIATVEFSLDTTVTLSGDHKDALIVIPPYGYKVLGVLASDFQVHRRQASSGQLNTPEIVELVDAVQAAPHEYIIDGRSVSPAMNDMSGSASSGAQLKEGAALRVPNLLGTMVVGHTYFVKISFEFPESGAEPSLLNPTTPEPGESACANAWGLAVESDGEHLATAFAPGIPLAYLAQFKVDCATRAFGADNLLTLSFTTTGLALASEVPKGSDLLLVFSLPSRFELASPAVKADFAAPQEYNHTTDPALLGTSSPEVPVFPKFGCPPFASYSRLRRLQTRLRECAVIFNVLQDVTEVVVVVDEMPAAATHELLLRVQNPDKPATGRGFQEDSVFGLSIFRTLHSTSFAQVPALAAMDNRDSLVQLQEPLHTVACDSFYPMMAGEIHASSCSLEGHSTEVTLGFIAPAVIPRPISGMITLPLGYSFPWYCDFTTTELVLPGQKRLEYIDASLFANCSASPDGRTITFDILRDLKGEFVWNYFTVKVINPTAENRPASHLQDALSLVVGGYAAGAVGTVGIPTKPIRFFTDLLLRELPFAYNSTSLALGLQMRVATEVPTGGYITVEAPSPFLLPKDQCRGENTTTYLPGQPTFVPRFRTRPFKTLEEVATGPVSITRSPEEPTRAACSVRGNGRLLVISVLEGALPPGLYELVFAAAVDSQASMPFLLTHAAEGPFARMLWNVESWAPAGQTACTGQCCSKRRDNFENIVGIPYLNMLDRGVLEAYPFGRFSARLVVPSAYGGWRFSTDPERPQNV